MKDRKRKYFGSLTHQLILISICLVTGTLLLCWFINTVFLEPYYVVNKQNTLLSGFETINEASENGSLDDSSFDVTFDNLCANGNITVMIISSDRTIVRSSVNDTQKMMLEFMNIIFGEKQNEVTVLMQSDNYIIQKQTDARLDSEYLVLYGTLSNGNLILMRTALESIRVGDELCIHENASLTELWSKEKTSVSGSAISVTPPAHGCLVFRVEN
jgi:two-component system, OmpR family, sensor histidine kinase VanS